MSNTTSLPFNISLLNPTPELLKGLKPVTTLDRFDGATKTFHENGFFSVSIFGKTGDERRNRRFSYIDIKVKIFHPVILRALIQLKKFYGDIIASKDYAIWNDEIKDFEKSTPMEGSTGFNFFVSHWKDIEFESRPSVSREQNIILLKKYAEIAMLDKIIVIPAGLRDIELQGDGRVGEDEINEFYRKLLSLANSITDIAVNNNPEVLDRIRFSLQNTFSQLYDYLENMIQGKKKLMMGKWASRKIFNGTRNVITAMNTVSEELDSKGNMGFNDTIVGLYQFLKASLPISRFNIKNGFLSKVFTGPNSPVVLVNKKTLKKETVTLNHQYFDSWMTDEGLEKVITSFGEENIRHKVLEISGYYVGLIYKGPDNTFKLLQSIDELPDGRSKDDVYPLTFCELLYLSVYETSVDYPVFVTRYPITGFGSIYPSKVFLKPTVSVEVRKELDDNWEPKEDRYTAYQFPIRDASFINSMSPSSTKLALLGADFDGD